MNVYEMEGFLRGKCLPGDLKVNESNAEYLVRKLSAVSELQGEVTALVATLEKSREVSGCPEGIDLQDWVKKLASESVALKQFPEQIVKFMGGLGTSEIGSDTKEKIELAASRIKTSATDRIYAEAEARGVEKFAKKLESRGRHQDYVEIANAFAKQLREGDK
ncbi:TPA: hypothetical protein QIM43_002282 [Klebsiella aerogenes]|uniref:hypothetical protein n=1 Tax=Klebsiella aerogenes TaxID=548 RepID=UPI002B0D216B|nr:hypothetical protein [Klebsiella aerogenes]HCB2457387.1 hypothetical protein [Klebsiella aerogenes]HEO9678084.1 hypothetical protein [Klebsiella aerogenes]